MSGPSPGSPKAGFRPPDGALGAADTLLAPWRLLTSPRFDGWEHVPSERPLLFVGNHTLFALLDAPLLFVELYRRRGIFLRSLGDHLHWRIPLWRTLLDRFGVVDGTRSNCAELMAHGEAILVFPGGGREVSKRKGEQYQLLWEGRLGFARMAIAHGCTIVPFSAVGIDDAFDIVVDKEQVLASPIGSLLRKMRFREDLIFPIVKGVGPTPLPRPDRLYFRFAPPVPTRDYAAHVDDPAAWREVRDRTRDAVQAGIDSLLLERSFDPRRNLVPRLASRLMRLIDR